MLKKLTLLLLIVAPISIFAQDKIAFINSQEIFYKMPEMKEVEAKLKAEDEAVMKNIKGIENEYNALMEKFASDTTKVTEAIFMDRNTQSENIKKRYDDYVSKSTTDRETTMKGLLAPLQEKLMKAIKEVGNENNYTYIIESGVMLYTGTNAIDASKAVKAKLGIVD